ncbi:MAG TPA: 3-methyl-2-oxobutanoate dehydrogenase subunit beta [Thermoplasmata archaeon]|nr:3-methyl-2-oxobutanoate dehydrogenase subunit beta [Thermoplasmata archaeon]
MTRLTIPEPELMTTGHLACPGCGATLVMRYLLKALGPRTIVTIPACCWAVMSGPFPRTALKVPFLDCAFEATGASIQGLRAGLDARGVKDVTVVGFAGDGGTVDIGLQSLSGALERGVDAIYVMYDNEAYMNTGIQRSGATPWGAWTTTTPLGRTKAQEKKDLMAIVTAHHIPYAATASIAFPEDFVRKLERAKSIRGPRFFHVLAPCPPGWKYPPEETVKLARLAVDARIFPLYEVDHGRYRITRRAGKKAAKDYLEDQGRFAHLTDVEISEIQRRVDERWAQLEFLEKATAEVHG